MVKYIYVKRTESSGNFQTTHCFGKKGIHTMTENKQYKIGDKIVEFGQVFRIFKIETRKDGEGNTMRILHFRPHFKSNDNKGMVCSIPEHSIKDTNIRRPVSKETIKELIVTLSTKPKRIIETDVNTLKEILGQNDLFETARVLRTLHVERSTTEFFTKSKRDMFELATSRLVEEVALVVDMDIEKADSKIRSALSKK